MRTGPLGRRAVLLIACLALVGCGGTSAGSQGTAGSQDAGFLAQHDLDGLSASQVIEKLDAMPVADRPVNLLASVQPDKVVLSDDRGNETQLPMPADEVYVAVAPYEQQTHDCHFHSLTTCLGELGGAEVQLTLTDDATGAVLLDESRQLYDNGFAGLWVPRGTDATLQVQLDGATGTADITTLDADDPTCVTTLRLT